MKVTLNDIEYAVLNDRRGVPLFREGIVDPFQTAFTITGRPDLAAAQGVTLLVAPNLSEGLGRDRIDSDSARKEKEYRRFKDATIDTRFERDMRLPILEEDSTETGLEVIRASAAFKSNLWGQWEDNTSTNLVARKYVGSETTTWTAGGNIVTRLAQDATANGNTSTNTALTVSHTNGTGNDRLLIVCVTATDASTTTPSGVTYGGTGMTSAGVKIQGIYGASIWYLVAPATGANNIVATFAATMDRIVLNSVSFTGAEQASPTRTAATDNSASGAAPSAAATSLANDIVVDCLATHINATLTVGASQTSLANINNTPLRHGSSKETAAGSSTTMSWSMSTAQPYGLVAVAVKSRVAVGLDLHSHKTHLLALCAVGDSQSIKRSTDGVTWSMPTTDVATGLLDNIVTANEDIDAGLLTTVGNEAVAVLWHESNGTITFYSSTDAGATWADEAVDIASGDGPYGVAVMNGIDNAQKLYVGTREGLYEVDTSPSTWTITPIRPMFPDPNNCRRMTVGDNGALWFAYGVDDDSMPIVYNMFTGGGVFGFQPVANDFSLGDSLPAARLGPIRWMQPVQGWMYVSTGGGKAGRNAGIFCHNGLGWHSMRKHGSANKKIEWIAASGDDDGTPRLHYAVRTAASTSDTKFLGQAFAEPSSGVTIKREASGYVTMPYLDAGFPLDSGPWLQYAINAEDLSASTSGEYAAVKYGVDDGSGGLQARSNSTLGNFLSGTKTIDFPSTSGGSDNGAGVSSANMGSELTLHRAGTNTNTPKMKDIQIAVIKEIPERERMEFTIDIQATMDLNGRTAENIVASIKAGRAPGELRTFTYGPTTKYVRVRQARWTVVPTVWGGVPAAVVDFGQMQRTGFVEVVLEEVI